MVETEGAAGNEATVDDDKVAPDQPDEGAREPDSGPAGWIIHLLIVCASIVAIISAVNVWVEQQVLDTDEWVEASDDLLADDEVREVVAGFLVDELYEAVDVADELDTRLPDNVDALAGILAAAAREPATDAVDRLLATDRVGDQWQDLNREAHQRLVQILTDDTGPALSTAEGAVTLDLGEMVQTIGAEFGLSADVLDELPDDIGVVTLFESDELARAQDLVRLVEVLSVVLFLLVVVLYGAAIYLAGPDRRRDTIRRVGLALALSGGLVLVALRIAARAAAAAAAAPDVRTAARVATDIGTEILRDMAVAGLAFGLLIAGYAALIGPSGLATWLRKLLAPALVTKPVGTWLSAIVIFLFVLYVLPGEPLETWWRGAIFVVLFAVALVALRRQLQREFPNASLLDSWDTLRAGIAGVRPQAD